MAVLLTLGLLFVAVAAWWSLVSVIPSCLRSSLVDDLWKIRDSLATDLSSGMIADRDAAVSLIGALELLIRNAREITPARAFFFTRIPDTLAESVQGVLPEPSGEGAERVVSYRKQTEQRVNRYLRVGSVSAWLALPNRILFGGRESNLAVLCRGLMLLEHFDALELGV